jgi:hypothetical protein
MKPRTYIEYVLDEPYKGLGAIRAKTNKRILRSLSFDNNGLVKPSCGTVALYGPFGFF